MNYWSSIHIYVQGVLMEGFKTLPPRISGFKILTPRIIRAILFVSLFTIRMRVRGAGRKCLAFNMQNLWYWNAVQAIDVVVTAFELHGVYGAPVVTTTFPLICLKYPS